MQEGESQKYLYKYHAWRQSRGRWTPANTTRPPTHSEDLPMQFQKNTPAKAVQECGDSGWGGESPHGIEEGNTRPETSAISGKGNDVYMLHVLIYHFTHTSLPFNRQLMMWVSRELNAGQHHQACESPSTLATTLSQIQLQRRFNKQLEEFAYRQVMSLKINLIKVY